MLDESLLVGSLARRCRLHLRDAAGRSVPSSRIAFRSLPTGLDGASTLAVRRFEVPTPGRLRLEATGFDPARVAGDSRLVLTRARGARLLASVLWVVVAAVALLASLVVSALAASAQPARPGVSVPPLGSPARTAILDAVRAELGMAGGGASRFKVFHLRSAGAWAYFEGNEIVRIEGHEWQETDMTVKALLREEDGRWQVQASWNLPDNERMPLRGFERRLEELRVRWQLPGALFP